MKRLLELFLISLKLGFTSFGGPVAHLGYFHTEYVKRLHWLSEKEYIDLVSLSQFLPGPASSQVGIGIGIKRAGLLGGITSFLGFTLPSVILLIIFATVLSDTSQLTGLIHGLKLVAVAIVLHAIISMAKNFTNTTRTIVIGLLSIAITLYVQSPLTHIIVILIGAFFGLLFIKDKTTVTEQTTTYVSKKTGIISLLLFVGLLVLTPIISSTTKNTYVQLFDSFYRSGSFVFGGGHVVLPLLETELVPHAINEEAFLAGYGATQAVPGPLFTFASYLGTVIDGIPGGLFATFAIFLPAFLLVVGVLPFWQIVTGNRRMREAVIGINAAVVGILFSTWITPISTSSVQSIYDGVVVLILFMMLMVMKLPPWSVVVIGAVLGIVVNTIF